MSTTPEHSGRGVRSMKGHQIDFKLEVVTLPVTDQERAKQFYMDLGWRLDADVPVSEGTRAIQLTPPGSPCSVHLGKADGSVRARGLFLVVSDVQAARAELIDRGVKVGEIFHVNGPGQPPIDGIDPQRHTYASFASFSDPDGNSWLLQEVTDRLPGRIDADLTTFSSSSDLASALRRAATAHGEHEKQAGMHDDGWPDWYAEYLTNEQSGRSLPM